MIKRVLKYKIDNINAGQTAMEFLKAKGYSSQLLIDIKKNPDRISLNGAHCLMKQVLSEGDLLVINICEEGSSEKIPAVELPLDIVYEDNDILVINKPADMPIHPSLNNYTNSLANAVAYYYEKQGIPFIYRCINRLDRDTSGLTLIAKHVLSGGILSQAVANKTEENGIKREYLAIVKGALPQKEGTINAPIARKGDSIIERIIDYDKGDEAITHYRVLKEENGHSLISLILETGRTHQIRVHMKHIGHPLIGDHLYNPDMEHISRQALHSYKLSFTHPITGERMTLTAPLPEDMSKIISIS